MSRFLSTPRPPADTDLHPIQIADRRTAEIRRQAGWVLVGVGVAMIAANLVGLLVTLAVRL
ncbi:MAG: hypothetical protein B7Y12_01955 [Rhizobiales bacterium 24-66-13]|jgi:hypothetical protein|nr:MAG: hypothetical protein B7Z41_03825 [Rhizobiales bacterium 12-66-7]OYY88786.1 MAG: hypothetical protein B7Y61_00990 [Rhizobiales bacterium 35-66-30]OYZ82780.1 MAG: hypothetical protein B7Y12_01955 [Rhizobiales bacterium 24-66-13]OZB11813.1 MAG: hypothetical protein B7X67_01935 [Rhizobiales bacterium 39-66-18]HQS09517.1 hypothetical protein [Xanthobacteraceae bacterium]